MCSFAPFRLKNDCFLVQNPRKGVVFKLGLARATMWPWPLTSLITLTLDLSRSNFEIAVSQELLVSLMQNEKWMNLILGRLYDLAPWLPTWHWPWRFKIKVWNSLISGMGQPNDMERNGCELSIHDHDSWIVLHFFNDDIRLQGMLAVLDHDIDLYGWPWRGWWMYRMVTGVTSDVGVPSTYLVLLMRPANERPSYNVMSFLTG